MDESWDWPCLLQFLYARPTLREDIERAEEAEQLARFLGRISTDKEPR